MVPRRHNARGLADAHYVLADPPFVHQLGPDWSAHLNPSQNHSRFTPASMRLRGHAVASTGNHGQPLSRCPLPSPGSRSGPSTAGAGRTTTTPTSTTSTRGTPSSTRRRSASMANTLPRSSRTWREEPPSNSLPDGPLNQCPLPFYSEAFNQPVVWRCYQYSVHRINMHDIQYKNSVLNIVWPFYVFCFTGLCRYFIFFGAMEIILPALI